ncbi:AAA domain-containing protein [Micromonospora zamorensis]|uniref:AAA domain-containing protein n=1 Tax=Micromonospora zamorensis TaxID=709883 RepID=UPI00371A5B15
MLRRFLEELRARLLHGDTASIGSLAAILAHEPSRLEMPQDQPARWTPLGERLLMPLPTNEAQESIARRLAQHRNVAVQGPPGTGKTHTIRNLICHLMAHGKRVLVVAQKEDPLRVLRDGLPQEIQSLCLAVLGRSTDQLLQLQLAARELSDRGATLDKRSEQQRVDRLRHQLEQAERDLGQALGGLRTMAENEAAHHEIGGIRLSPSDVGIWLRERAERYGDIPDDLAPQRDAPLSADDFTELLDIARRTVKQDRAQALLNLPTAVDLPPAVAILTDRQRLDEAARELNQLAAAGVSLPQVRAFGPQPLDDLAAQLREALTVLAAREGSWTDRLGTLVQAAPNWHHMWYDHVAACQRALGELTSATRIIAGHQVTVPEVHMAEPRRLLAQLGELRQRFAAGKGVNRLFQGALAKLASECHIDGESVRSCDDIDIIVAYVGRQRLRQELTTRWQEWTQPLELTIPAAANPETWAGRMLAEAESTLDWDRRRWPALYSTLRGLLPTMAATVDTRRLSAHTDLVARCATVFTHDGLLAVERDLAAALQTGMSSTDASELWRLLDLSRQSTDLDRWDSYREEVRRLAALRPDAERFQDLSARLREAAPGWTATIDDGTAPALAGNGTDCLHRWRWRQAQTWFDTVVGSVDPVALGRRVEQIRERIRRLTQELVVASSWLEVSKALDDRRRAALADWTTALRKIGKGTGKNAALWQAHAQRAMSAAVDAVPVWVMSVDRAIEQFASGAHFDVVIVDEASQADVFSLPILSLAERAVVVGDDQQIGPQLSFVGAVTGLINSHLVDVPSAEHFDPESSLYDHAVRRSPERILLTEHFRSVPAIIGFSSQTYYGGEIEPLRTDRPAGIGDPVIAVHVPEGIRQDLTTYGNVNVAEAEALVARVAAIVADHAYAGRTIGVVSLLSTSGQALYLLTRLREQIGEEEMERRRLRVGDSYTFQGDERDIVLVSLVVSPHQGPVSAFTKRDHHRRVNVAASRARDQLWVFHSVQPADMREDDARGLLLTYCQNVAVAEEAHDDLEKRCDSDFERGVLRRILLRGYRPLPQFRIGSYRIDFVLPAPDGRRLAIECDGDAYHGPEQWESDMGRQAVLERVGNCVFVRIRGSVFSRDPEAAMEPLWQRIDELGIGTASPSVAPVIDAEAEAVLPMAAPSSIAPSSVSASDAPGSPLLGAAPREVEPNEVSPGDVVPPAPPTAPPPPAVKRVSPTPAPTVSGATVGSGYEQRREVVVPAAVIPAVAMPALATTAFAAAEAEPDAEVSSTTRTDDPIHKAEPPVVAATPATVEAIRPAPTAGPPAADSGDDLAQLTAAPAAGISVAAMPAVVTAARAADESTLATDDVMVPVPVGHRNEDASAASGEQGVSEAAADEDAEPAPIGVTAPTGSGAPRFTPEVVDVPQAHSAVASPTLPAVAVASEQRLSDPATSVAHEHQGESVLDEWVPPGYRSIAWLRPYEAMAALESYRNGRDTPIRHGGKVLGWARYQSGVSAEARPHRADVRIERAEAGGPRFVCWVRQNEAEAIIRTASLRKDSPCETGDGRREGLVQYFAPTNPAAIRNRSVTRLLRFSWEQGAPRRSAKAPVDTVQVPAGMQRKRSNNSEPRPAMLRGTGQEGLSANPSVSTETHGRRDGALSPSVAPEMGALDRRSLEALFHREMVRICQRARDEASYHPSLLLRLVTEKGGLASARQLLHSPAVSDGFTALWERGRVDLTTEALALRPEFHALFTEDELTVARSRVKAASS